MPSPSEFDFIDWVRQQSVGRDEIVLGIGDDAAILSQSPDREWVSAVDVITEGVHFTSETSPKLVGRKALAINLSDIAAMAATPVATFIGIVLPKTRGRKYVENLYGGLLDLAKEYDICIAGGDTNSWDGPLVISVTVMGTVPNGQAILRSGAKSGDWLFVTGAVGGSLNSERHLKFDPRVREARVLVGHFDVTSMIDISDGLAGDVRHIAAQSEVGIVIEGDQVPIHSDVDSTRDPEVRLNHALTDGEDFELLFTVSPQEGTRLLRKANSLNLTVSKIGECTTGSELRLRINGAMTPFPVGGWCHELGY